MSTAFNSPMRWSAARTPALVATAVAGALLAAAALAPVRAQTAADLQVDKALRTKVIEATADFADANYVFPDHGAEIARSIRKHFKDGTYNDVSSAADLAARLTADMQAVTPDRHLKVLFSAEARPMQETAGEPTAEEMARRRLDAARQNFGIERAEHLDGNVGYLKLTKFEDPAIAGETLTAAMRFLSNTDALIVDLRFNGGGHADMVALLTSYFFDGEPMHLVDFFDRVSGETSQSWTLPYVPGPRYLSKPVFILTGERTFSAAEQFTYSMQKVGRAVVVGQQTRGGAHFVKIFQVDGHFAVMIPVGNTTSPLTGSNWEGVGITPDVAAANEVAVRTAHRRSLEKLLETAEGRRAELLNTLISEMKDETAQGAK